MAAPTQDAASAFPGEAVTAPVEMVTAPDGTKAPAIDPESGESFFGWNTNEQGKTIPAYGPKEALQAQAAPDFLDQAGAALGRGTRDVMNVAGSAADLVSLPVTTLMRLLGADVGSYRDLTNKGADALGLDKSETGGEKLISALNEGAGLGALTAGAGGLIKAAPGAVGAVGEALAATPAAGVISSATGSGAGELAEQAGAGPTGQMAASLAGGLGGAGAALGVPAAARRVTQSTVPSDLLAAFTRQQVTPMADQVGGTGSRMASGVSRMTLGGLPLAEAAEKSILSARAARDRIAGTMGRVTDDTGAGQAAQRGGKSFLDTTEARGGKLYDAIPVPAQKDASLASTRSALAELNAGLKSNELLSEIIADRRLQAFQQAIDGNAKQIPTGVLDASGNPVMRSVRQGGRLSWEDLKAFRSYVGELAGRPTMQDNTSKAALQRLYAGLSEDMRATAAGEGPGALKAFTRANSYWRARQSRIDDTLTAIFGKDMTKSPEDAFKQIERWSREGGDAARIARLIRSLPADEAGTVRATIFSKMGDVPAGRQDMTGTVFSPADFATQWAKLDHRAKSVLFPGAEYRQDLDDIARIADAMKRSGEFANTSRTALAGNGIGLVTMALAGSPFTAGGIAGAQVGFGKLMASPRFARWLASGLRKPNGPATLAHINRLSAIAAAEPNIGNEVLRLQERLAGAFTNAPQRAAAEESEQ